MRMETVVCLRYSGIWTHPKIVALMVLYAVGVHGSLPLRRADGRGMLHSSPASFSSSSSDMYRYFTYPTRMLTEF